MQKELHVIRIITVVFILFISGISYCQIKLNGRYSNLMPHQEHYNFYIFNMMGEFEYHSGASLGDDYFGKGDYKIEDGNLILNYNKTEPLKIGRHISEIWTNKTDSITVHFVFLDFNNDPIPYVNIFYKDNLSKNGYSGVEDNKEGEAVLNLKKEKSDFEFNFSNLGYRSYKISIDKNYNYHITVFLEADGKGIPIKNQIDTLRIVELKDDFFKVKGKDGKIINWSKID